MTLRFLPEQIERWPLARLKPYARNPRLHSDDQVARIAASLVEYGFTSPLLIADDGTVIVHGANIQDRDGAVPLIASMRHLYPWLRHLFADGAYAGAKLKAELAKLGKRTMEIVSRSKAAKGFEVLPRRWVVERTLAWLCRNRRLAKDFEASIPSAVAWVLIANIRLLTRRLARA